MLKKQFSLFFLPTFSNNWY